MNKTNTVIRKVFPHIMSNKDIYSALRKTKKPTQNIIPIKKRNNCNAHNRRKQIFEIKLGFWGEKMFLIELRK